MIARVWHGSTKPEDADAYEAMLKPEVEFITIMLWDSIDSRGTPQVPVPPGKR